MSMNKYKISSSFVTIAIVAATFTFTPLTVLADNASVITGLQAQIVALQTQLNTLLASSGSTFNVTSCGFARSLFVGTSGADVKCLQDYLRGTGHFTFSVSTGTFGPITKTAVIAWQTNNSLPATGYFGSLSRTKYNVIVVTLPTPTVEPTPVVVNIVKVTSDNPTSAPVAKTATNFKMLEVKFDGTGTVDTLTVKKIGFSNISDYRNNGVYLYKDGVRLGNLRTFSSNDYVATFNNLNLQAPFVLSVMADFEGVSGNVAKVELNGNYAGLSIKSNDFTFVNLNLGKLILTNDGSSLDDLSASQDNALVAQFKVYATSTNEAISVKYVELYNGGFDILSNVKITDGTNTWSGTLNGSKLVFHVDTLIKAGKTKTFKVYADVDGDSDETIKLYVRNDYDVKAVGDEYKFGVKVDTSGFDENDSTVLSLEESGSMEVKKITSESKAVLFEETVDVLGFKMKNKTEPFDVTELKFSTNSSVVEKLALYSNSTLLATEEVDVNTVTFDSLDIRINGTKDFVVKAILKSQEDADVDTLSFTTELTSYKATGVNSDDDLAESVNAIVGKEVTVYPSFVKIVSVMSGGTFTSSLNKKVFDFKVYAVGDDVEIASSTPFVKLAIDTNGSPTSYGYKLKHNSDVIASGFITGSTLNITTNATTTNDEDSSIEITEGDYAEFVLTVDTTDFTEGDDNFFSVAIDDVDGVISWKSKNVDDEWLEDEFNSKANTIDGLPVDPIEFN